MLSVGLTWVFTACFREELECFLHVFVTIVSFLVICLFVKKLDSFGDIK
jgi:hypothetical protein